MPTTNNEFKVSLIQPDGIKGSFRNSLRIQRDDWAEVIEYLNNAGIDHPEIEKAKRKANRVLSRITESLQD